MLSREASATIDKTRLSPNLWIRMMWLPREDADPKDRPVVLLTDRRRFWFRGIPMMLGLLLAIVILVFHGPIWLAITALVIVGAVAFFDQGTNAYYEVRKDGTLGDYLGKNSPGFLREMRQTRP
jgi:hypothetical protein